MKLNNMDIYLNDEYKKYEECCGYICYFYFKSKNEIISITEIARSVKGNTIENKKIIKRILRGLGKNILLLDKVSLTYSDCMKLYSNIRNEKMFKFQFVPFVISMCAFMISIVSAIMNVDYIKSDLIFQIICIVWISIIFLICTYYIFKFFKNN